MFCSECGCGTEGQSYCDECFDQKVEIKPTATQYSCAQCGDETAGEIYCDDCDDQN